LLPSPHFEGGGLNWGCKFGIPELSFKPMREAK